jgi:glycosyltransferase 2 family protein
MKTLIATASGRRLFGGWTGGAVSALAVAVLAVLIARADWAEMIRSLAAANPLMLGLAIALALTVEVSKGARWLLLLGLDGRVFPRLLAVLLSGRVLNAVAPLRAGDVWRIASVAAREERPVALVAGSVMVEKLLDGSALALCGILLLGSKGLEIAGIREAALAGAVLLAAVLLAVYAGRRVGRHRLERWIGSATHLRDMRVMAGVLALTLAGMGLGVAVNLVALGALGLPVDAVAGAIMLLSVYALALVPSGPGQVGVFELGVSTALMGAGMPAGAAVAAAVGLHLILLGTLAIGGLASLLLNAADRTGDARLRDSSLVKESIHGR